MAKMLRTQSDLMHVRQILQYTDAERLAKAPQASHAFENDSYRWSERYLHIRRLGPHKILSSNKNDYRLQDLISKREFSTNITRLVPFIKEYLIIKEIYEEEVKRRPLQSALARL